MSADRREALWSLALAVLGLAAVVWQVVEVIR